MAAAEIATIDASARGPGSTRGCLRALLATATLLNWAALARAARRSADIPLSVIFQSRLRSPGTSVHENHTFLPWSWPRCSTASGPTRALLAAASAFLFASLYLTAGFGRRITTQSSLESLRAAFGLDLTVLVAVAHVAFVAVLLVSVARTSSGKVRSVAP